MKDHKFGFELENICFTYERLTSLISLLYMLVAEVAEVKGLREDSLSYALYEIESGMDRNNEALRGLITGNKANAPKTDGTGMTA